MEKKNMIMLIEVKCKNKDHWSKIKKIVSHCLFKNEINYSMVDQEYGMIPKTFDIKVKTYKVE